MTKQMKLPTLKRSFGAPRRLMLHGLYGQITVISILATVGAQCGNAQSYTVTELSGGPVGIAINVGGQISGYGALGEELWTPKKLNGATGKSVSLPPLAATGKSSSNAYVTALNSSGTVAGYTEFSRLVNKVTGQYTLTYAATVWQNSAPVALPSGGLNSWAKGINSSGDVVGEIQGIATLWHDAVANSLSTPANCTSSAYAVNDSGQIVGVIRDSSGVNHATLWKGGTSFDLGTPSIFSGGYAVGINNAGAVTCNAIRTDLTGT